MIAFDTCVLVRFLADDDPAQAEIAERMMREHTVYLPNTVLLETEWVLRSRYHRQRAELLDFFRLLCESENVALEDTAQFEMALAWYAAGADFADAMHLASCGEVEMHTFDRSFCKAARESGSAPGIHLLG